MISTGLEEALPCTRHTCARRLPRVDAHAALFGVYRIIRVFEGAQCGAHVRARAHVEHLSMTVLFPDWTANATRGRSEWEHTRVAV